MASVVMRRRDVNMTQGSIVTNIVKFALPLLAGNLFQQLYNMVDTWVIGQTGETGAYAAVGSVGPIINILIGFFSGLASGAGVVISQYYGAGNEKKVHDAVHTSMLFTLVMGVLFTVLGVTLSPVLLRLVFNSEQTKNEVLGFANTYLRIYFSGVMGLMIYNMAAGILRAVGDSQRPFYFLVVSAVSNIILDLLFVFRFNMGVAGVAWATVISQVLSAVFSVFALFKSDICIKLYIKDLKFHGDMMSKIVSVGMPAAIQMALTAFSNVFVQSYIAGVNTDQTYCLGGWTTYNKIDQLLFLPIQSLALAVTTFVGQNLGVGDIERAKKGTYIVHALSSAVTVVLMIPIILFAPQISSVFNKDENVIHYSALLLRNLTPFYILPCINQTYSASLRGMGRSRAAMIIMLCSFVGFRQLYLYVITNYVANEILPVGFSYPAGWFVCSVTLLIFFHSCDLSKNRLVEKHEVVTEKK